MDICSVCQAQTAEFLCACSVLLCIQCTSLHEQDQESETHVYTSIAEKSESDEKANLEIERLSGDAGTVARAINQEFDEAVETLNQIRRRLLKELERIRVDSIAKIEAKNILSESIPTRSAMGRHRKTLKTMTDPLVSEAQYIKESLFRIPKYHHPKSNLTEPSNPFQNPFPIISNRADSKLFCIRPKTGDIYQFLPESESLEKTFVRSKETLPKFGTYSFVPEKYLFYCGGKESGGGKKTGFVSSEAVLIRLDSGEAVSKGKMIMPRFHHATVYESGNVYIFGGYQGNHRMTSGCEKYSVSEDRFYQIASMHHERDKIGAVDFNQKIYIAGYGNSGSKSMSISSCIEIYDIAKDQFFLEPFSFPSNSGTIGFAYGNCIAFMRSYQLFLYDTVSGRQEKHDIQGRRYGTCTQALVSGSKIYYFLCTDDEQVLCVLDWNSKKCEDVLNLRLEFN